MCTRLFLTSSCEKREQFLISAVVNKVLRLYVCVLVYVCICLCNVLSLLQVYKILVRKTPDESWVVFRRYTDFSRLNDKVCMGVLCVHMFVYVYPPGKCELSHILNLSEAPIFFSFVLIRPRLQTPLSRLSTLCFQRASFCFPGCALEVIRVAQRSPLFPNR